MTQLEKFKAVNACETIEELQACIRSFANKKGMIKGRSRYFSAESMALGAMMFYNDEASANVITREFGLRQQAIYLKHYKP